MSTDFSSNSGQTIRIKVLILTKYNTTGILKAYCMFTEEYDRNRVLYGGRTAEAVMKTIEFCNECEDTVPIREYLKERTEELISIMSDEERQRRLIDKIVEYEREEAKAEGKAEGKASGEVIGRKKGKFETLLEFIKDGVITEDTAAKKANMSIDDFRKTAALYS